MNKTKLKQMIKSAIGEDESVMSVLASVTCAPLSCLVSVGKSVR